MISERASSYLKTLNRGAGVPLDVVRTALEHAGVPALDVWLDFHSRFGGYEERLGEDVMTWGLVHAAPEWLDPNEVSVQRYGAEWFVTCADGHPSYDYELSESGEFTSCGGGGPCERFELKVEQDAVVWEAKRRGRWTLDLDMAKLPRDALLELATARSCHLIAEASDRYTRCLRSERLIVFVGQKRAVVWRPVGSAEY